MIRPALLILTALFATEAWGADHLLKGLDDVVSKARLQGGAPGLSVVVVHDDQVVIAKGYGTRTVRATEPVDADTLFGLASLTKAFTSTAMGILVDRKAVRLDDPVVAALPGFRVQDPYVSRQASIRDLLAHRTGTPSSNLLWYAHPDATRSDLVERLPAMPQTVSLRESFIYNNVMYLTAGAVIERASGRSWEDFVTGEILQPLGMTRSTVHKTALAASTNVATPHILLNGTVRTVPHSSYQITAPSGGIYSSANDVARWMRFLLNRGELEGKRLINPEVLAETMTPQMIIGRTSPLDELQFPGASFIDYGMGWFISDYHGEKVLSHTGGTDGMGAFIALLPGKRVGVAVLENLEGDFARIVIRNWIFDRYLQQPETDWVGRLAQLRAASGAAASQPAEKKPPRTVRVTREELREYAQRFANPLIGTIEVQLDSAGRLQCRLESLQPMPLKPLGGGKFSFEWPTISLNAPGLSQVTFQRGPDGAVSRLLISGPVLDDVEVFDVVRQ